MVADSSGGSQHHICCHCCQTFSEGIRSSKTQAYPIFKKSFYNAAPDKNVKMKIIYLIIGLILVVSVVGVYTQKIGVFPSLNVNPSNNTTLPNKGVVENTTPPNTFPNKDFPTTPPIAPPQDKDFPTQIQVCEGLSAEECFTNDNCLGNYGPSFCSGDMCTQDMVFKSCGPSGLNSEEIQQIRSECDKINGEFRKDKFWGYECLCTNSDHTEKYICLRDLIFNLSSN